MANADVWRFASDHVKRGIPLVLLVVVETTGETPGKPGFKMAVAGDGELYGTIGGGAFEHDLVEEARGMLQSGAAAPAIRRLTLNPSLDRQASMICGGVAAAALCPLTPRDLPAVNRAAQSVASGEKVRLVIAPDRLACEPAVAEGPAHVFCETETGAWRYDERLGAGDTVYVAGGGHVALALSRVLAALDFRVWVFDDRPDVGTVKANRYADGISIIPFEEFGSHVEDGDESYVLIMTPSHRADERVLRQLVGRPLRYLGMMASRTKAAELLEHLRREGVAEEHLQRVRTPVGIPIQSHTAEEIAISIAAELILVRNSRKPAVTAPVGRRES